MTNIDDKKTRKFDRFCKRLLHIIKTMSPRDVVFKYSESLKIYC